MPPPPPPSRPVETGKQQLLDMEIAGNETASLTPALMPSSKAAGAGAGAVAPAASTVCPQDHVKKAPPPVPKKPASLAGKKQPVDLLGGEPEGLDSGVGSGSSGGQAYKPQPPPSLPRREKETTDPVASSSSSSSATAAPGITRRGGNMPAPIAPSTTTAPVSAPPQRVGDLRPIDQRASVGPPKRTTGGPVYPPPPPGPGRQVQGTENPDLAAMSKSMSSLSAKSGASSGPVKGNKDNQERENRDMLLDDDGGSEGLLGWQALRPG